MNRHSERKHAPRPYPAYYYSAQRRPAVRSYTPVVKNPPSFRSRFIVAVFILGIVGGGAYFLFGKQIKADSALTHNLFSNASNHTTKQVIPEATSTATSYGLAKMSDEINDVINHNSDVEFSVSLVDLGNDKTEQFGDDDSYLAASTGKLITATDFLHEVEGGSESLNAQLDGHSANYEIQQMIVVSDDNAWADLDNDLGDDNIQAYASSVGLSDYDVNTNSLTSSDIGLLLQKLWQGQLLNSTDTQLLLGYMKDADYRQYIVPAVPSSDTVYHKIGLYDDYVNDSAIITNGQQAFVLVIFTNGNGTYNWPARAQMMQTIASAAIHTYL